MKGLIPMTKADSVHSTPPINASKIPTGFLNAVARIHLSHLMRDPFVRDAFERAERGEGDGFDELIEIDHPPSFEGP
jgi:hypothetical protein